MFRPVSGVSIFEWCSSLATSRLLRESAIMPKKFKAVNTKAEAARERKAAAREEESARRQQAAEDEYWRDDDRDTARKQQRKV